MRVNKYLFLFVLCACVLSPIAFAVTVNISAYADSYMDLNSKDTNYGSSTLLSIYPGGSRSRHSIIKFDVSSIPPNATISSAVVYLKEAGTAGYTRTIGFHKIQQSPPRDWIESQVTWKKYNLTGYWTIGGAGDCNDTPSATVTVVLTGDFKWDSWNVTADVQDFRVNPSTNFGWVIKDESEDASTKFWNFWSKEVSGTQYDPYLEVVYAIPPTGPTLSTDKPSYNNCGVAYYRVSVYNQDDQLVDADIIANVIDSLSAIVDIASGSTSGGVYSTFYTLSTSSQTGSWKVKAYSYCESAQLNVTAQKSFTVS